MFRCCPLETSHPCLLPQSKRKSSKLFPSNSKKADIFICAQICEQIWGLAHLCAVGWVDQSSLTLYNPMDCSPPGSSVHGTLQARILERVAMPSCRASSRPRDQAHIYMCAQICEQTLGISHLYNFKSFLFCQQKKESQSYYTVVLKSQPCFTFSLTLYFKKLSQGLPRQQRSRSWEGG